MARMNELTDLAIVIGVMEVTGALKGKRVSITGHMGRPRPEIVKIIETAGGQFDERPKWGTTYLVTNQDWNAGSVKNETGRGKKVSSKFTDAQKNGVKIITEQQFYDIIMGEGETFATLAEKNKDT